MRVGKIVGTVALATSLGVFAADEKRKRYLIPDLEYGFEALTGYTSNANYDRNEEGSMTLTFRPFLTYDKEFGAWDLTLSYNPEMRWYEVRDKADKVEWDHVLSLDTSFEITPTMNLEIKDKFFNVHSDEVQDFNGVTERGGDNDYVRNVLNLDYEWEFRKGTFITSGYINEYLEYDDKDNEYRNGKANEVYLGYKRAINSESRIGAKLVYGRINFWESARTNTIGGVTKTTDRDSEWYRALLTGEISDGPWRYNTEVGLDYHKVTNDTFDGVDDTNAKPYAKLKVDYYLDSKGSRVLTAEAAYRTIPSYQEEVYFAGQSKGRLGYKHKFSERLDLSLTATYDDIYYDQKYTRTGLGTKGNGSDDHETWVRLGFLFTYNWLQDVDVLIGMSHDNLINAPANDDEYTVNNYDIGILWKF